MLAVVSGALFGVTDVCRGGLIIEVSEIGGNLSFDIDGSLDIKGYELFVGVSTGDRLLKDGGDGGLHIMDNGGIVYHGDSISVSGTSPLPVGTTQPSITSNPGGGAVGFTAFGDLALPSGFSGGQYPTTNMTIAGASLASFDWSVGSTFSGKLSNGDTITFTAVPEPSGALLSLIPVCALMLTRRRRRMPILA